MVHLACPKCGEVMSSNTPVHMMGFIDFTILPDGKIKINGVWTSPKRDQNDKIAKKNVVKFEGVKNDGGGIDL